MANKVYQPPMTRVFVIDAEELLDRFQAGSGQAVKVYSGTDGSTKIDDIVLDNDSYANDTEWNTNLEIE